MSKNLSLVHSLLYFISTWSLIPMSIHCTPCHTFLLLIVFIKCTLLLWFLQWMTNRDHLTLCLVLPAILYLLSHCACAHHRIMFCFVLILSSHVVPALGNSLLVCIVFHKIQAEIGSAHI